MKSLLAFTKKEILGQIRSKKTLILTIVFVVMGILNPLMAKISPWLTSVLSEALESSGISITIIESRDVDSWAQYFSNLTILAIVFAILFSNIFTKEYNKGTLVLVLTKGFERCKVVISKLFVMILMWTIYYFMYFIVTFVITKVLWHEVYVQQLAISVILWWVFGIFVVVLMTLFSTIFNSSTASLAVVGGIVFGVYFLSVLPGISRFLPTSIANSATLIYGLKEAIYYLPAIIITVVLIIVIPVISILRFNKKKLY